ncbi:hypothetical protein P9A53_gp07 [Xanthomonas phage vB_Xar_IVIA-DoCa6]|uniref:Uncharacterized protein n=1 Tax=Xanthomonas phage vB_Xar_IVIA-DoCa6 TaxID=2975533 RepID=A0A9X9NYZ1_9CAUD|nr:hypothetical protein P9A53_gp07 [Xanthomonas phage vB_Xar_IVIA-DoCa6]UYA98751.1 hypothetical protein IVIADoCa6_7 [Xanthomonas phage vB_Xar_IVIA-DoCa6]
MDFSPPNFWLTLAIVLFAVSLAWLARSIRRPGNMFRAGIEYALAELYLAADPEEAADRLWEQSSSAFEEPESALEFDRGIREGIRLYVQADESGVRELEELRSHLTNMAGNGEASLSEVGVALDVIDRRLGVGGYRTTEAGEQALEQAHA